MDTRKLYNSLKQGDIIYDTRYVSDYEVKEFEFMCRKAHKDVNEPHKLHRIIKHCERIRSNGPWEVPGVVTKADSLKPRRELLKKAKSTGWIVETKAMKYGHGRKRGTLITYILSHPSGYVSNIWVNCKYNDIEKLNLFSDMIEKSNEIIEKSSSLVENVLAIS